MKLNVTVMNPSGSITALVEGELLPEERRALSERLLQDEKIHIEQVGFLSEPTMGGSVRLEMMGGEFCGNTLRCTALFHALRQGESARSIIPVEISGCNSPVAVAVDTRSMDVCAAMPLPVRNYAARIEDIPCQICDFGGIVHFVIADEYPDQDIIDCLLQYAVVHFEAQAYGLIFLAAENRSICPVVYVPEVGSLVFENSCASGTVAASVYAAAALADGRHHFIWHQPGGELYADIVKKSGSIERIMLSGRIEIIEKREFDFEPQKEKAEIYDINGYKNNKGE